MKSTFDQLIEHPIIKKYYKTLKAYVLISMRRIKRYAGPLIKTVKKEFPSWFSNSVMQFFAVLIIISMLSLLCVLFQVGNRFDNNLYIVNIPKGYSAGQVGELLLEKGLINGKYGYNLMINMFRMQNKIQAGTYEFTPNMSLVNIVFKVRNGDVMPPMLVRMIFPEGSSIYKMGQYIEKEGVSDGAAFQRLTMSAITNDLISEFPFLSDVGTKSLEGYFFPDTYLVPSNISSDQMAMLMLSRFEKVVMPYWNKNKKKMKKKMSLHEVLTLASIIEKEAEVGSERPIISSVYHNRLTIRMHLGADPTIKYVLERPGKIVSYDDLQVKSPYNTYRNYGLPPGPICSPGLESIKAAMFPAKTDFIYFVAKADGSHIFSKTWQEHEVAKEATRKERVRKIYKRQ